MRNKQVIFICFFLLFFIFGCRENEEIQYFNDGSIKMKAELKNGRRHGTLHSYYSNGSLRSKSSWKDGLQDGVTEFYHKNGNIKERTNWKKDKVNGFSEEFYANGKLKKKAHKVNGNTVGELTIFSSNGEPVETQIYDQKGNLIYIRSYGKMDRGTEFPVPIFEEDKDTLSLKEAYNLTVSFAYKLSGDVRMIVGSVDEMNKVTDTAAVVKPTSSGKFMYPLITSSPGEKSISIKFVHNTKKEDTLSVNDLSINHSYYVMDSN